jgi:pimeloyl-ACP methyl ester carboxylesterase/ketosteroid isomerase-like protein
MTSPTVLHTRRPIASAIIALVLIGGKTDPAASQTPAPAPDSALAPLAFLIGKWEEELVAPPSSDADRPPNHVELSWDLGGRVMRRSEVRSDDGKAWRGTGLIAWNPVSQRIELQEHADWGNFLRGTIEVLEEGVIRRNLEVSDPDGSTASWRTTVHSTGEDSFRTETEKLVDGEWRKQWELTGERVASFPWEVSAVARPGGYRADDAAMARFGPFLGIWGPPPGEEAAGYRLLLEWGIPNKTVRSSEYRTVDGELVQATEAVIGYHYGRQRIEYLEFVRDGLAPFEVMNDGFYEFSEDGSLVRRYRSFDPDMSSREYRETYALDPDGNRVNTIEYRDNDGAWQPWPRGPFRSVRYPTLAGGGAGNARAGASQLAPQPDRGRMVDIGGLRLLLDCVGTGSPTVIIDGGAGTWSVHYRHIQDALAGDTRVCTFDRAGLGRSGAAPGPRTSSDGVTELHALLRAAEIEPPYVLVGHSYGGYGALIYHRRYANEVAGVVLVESGHRQQWERLPAEIWASVEAAVPAMFAFADAVAADQIPAAELPPWPGDLPAEHRAEYEQAVLRPELHRTIAEEFAGARVSAHQVPSEGLEDLPLVVLSAGRSFDAFIGTGMPIEPANQVWTELQRELASLSSSATHLISEAATHDIHRDDPGMVVDAIRLGLRQARGCVSSEPSLSTLGIHRLPSRSTSEIDALLEGIEEAYRAMDVDAFVGHFTDDVQQLDINRRVLIQGRDAWRTQTVDVNGAHLWMERVHHGRLLAGDRLIVEIEWAGQLRGQALGADREDRKYRYTGLGVLELAGNRVRRQTLYADFATLAAQLDGRTGASRCASQPR